jgi:hypothetical protein
METGQHPLSGRTSPQANKLCTCRRVINRQCVWAVNLDCECSGGNYSLCVRVCSFSCASHPQPLPLSISGVAATFQTFLVIGHRTEIESHFNRLSVCGQFSVKKAVIQSLSPDCRTLTCTQPRTPMCPQLNNSITTSMKVGVCGQYSRPVYTYKRWEF